MTDFSIALWGPTQAGKTAFLAQLYLRPGAIRGEWDVFPTAESELFIQEVRSRTNRNHFPDATMSGIGRKVTYMFRNSKSNREATLFVEDRAGRECTELDEEGKKRLNDASGIILLFDPERMRDLEQQIESTLRSLHVAADRRYQKDRRPTAVCLSKADLLIETPADLKRAREYPDEFVRDKVQGDVMAWVSNFCSNFKLFPVSSLGTRLRYGVFQPTTFVDENCRPRFVSGSQPLNLIEPFEWLFQQIEGDQRQ